MKACHFCFPPNSVPAIVVLSVAFALGGCSAVPGDAALRGGHYDIARQMYEEQYRIGNPDAGYRLADWYMNGWGNTIADPARAFQIYSELATKGEVIAAHDLGVCYEYGKGIPIDYKLSAAWYKTAADRGYLFSLFNLGTLYADDYVVPRNDVEGLTLLLEAAILAKHDDSTSLFIREDRSGHIGKISKRMTLDEIAKARLESVQRASKWKGYSYKMTPPLVTNDGNQI